LAAVDKEPGQPRLAFVHVDDVLWTDVVAQQHGDRGITRLPNPDFTPPPGVADGLGSGDRWS
jgi:hypothetical protein